MGENLLESAPYNWDVMVENDKNLTAKEEIDKLISLIA